MGQYSIKDLEKVSGIKAHTIRIWEKRYSLIQPERSTTNIRNYDDNDLKKIINVSILSRNGFKISKIAAFTDQEIKDKVLMVSGNSSQNSNIIENLVLAMIELDEAKFDKLFSNVVFNSGFENAFIQVMYPFFDKIGLLWHTGCINTTHEHFVSNLVRQKLIVAIDGQQTPVNERLPKYLLFLPEGEFHEIGLLFYHYIIKKRGFKSVFLGQTVPFDDLVQFAQSFKPDILVTVINNPLEENELNELFVRLNKTFPNNKIYAGGEIINRIPPNFSFVKTFKTPKEFIDMI